MPQKRQSPGQRGNATRASQQTPHAPQHTTAGGRFSHFTGHAKPRTGTNVLRGALPGSHLCAYSRRVAANSATGFGDPIKQKAHKRPNPIAGAFFVPAMSCYGGCAWDTSGYAGFLLPRFANLRTAATHNRLATVRGSSSAKGAPPMMHSHALNSSARSIRAAAHKAMAFAALHADSSLASRLTRYNHHMQRARILETQEVCHV